MPRDTEKTQRRFKADSPLTSPKRDSFRKETKTPRSPIPNEGLQLFGSPPSSKQELSDPNFDTMVEYTKADKEDGQGIKEYGLFSTNADGISHNHNPWELTEPLEMEKKKKVPLKINEDVEMLDASTPASYRRPGESSF